MLMKIVCTVLFCALAASLPVSDHIVPESEFLARSQVVPPLPTATLPTKPTGTLAKKPPGTLALNPTASALHAQNQADQNAAAAQAAKAEEDEAAQAEHDLHEEASASGKEVRDDEKAAEEAEAAQRADMARDAASATKSIMDANAATATAEADNAAKQKKYQDIEAAIDAAGGHADAAAAARKTKVGNEIAANVARIAKLKGDAHDAQTAAADAHAAHVKNLADTEQNYENQVAAIKAKRDKDEADSAAEMQGIKDKYNGLAHNNLQKFEMEKAALAEEKANDEKAAADEKARIDAHWAKVDHDHDVANKAWHDQEADEAAARHSSRQATRAAYAKKAQDEEAAYQATMGDIASQKAAADQSTEQWEDDMQKSKEEQARMDTESDEDAAADAEIAECKIDGTECQTADEKCHNMTAEGFFMACDGFSCRKSDPGDCYDNWAHIPAALPRTPLKPETQKCRDLRGKIPAQFASAINAHPQTHPLLIIGCSHASRADMKAGLNAFLDSAEECPPFCMPKSTTSTAPGDTAHGMQAGGQDTNGLCVPEGAITQVKQNLNDIPVYTNSGTNGRFEADISTTMCDFVTHLVHGWIEGLGDDSSESAYLQQPGGGKGGKGGRL